MDAAPVEVDDRRVVVVGVATDDRGVARIWFTRGGQTIGEQTVGAVGRGDDDPVVLVKAVRGLRQPGATVGG